MDYFLNAGIAKIEFGDRVTLVEKLWEKLNDKTKDQQKQ